MAVNRKTIKPKKQSDYVSNPLGILAQEPKRKILTVEQEREYARRYHLYKDEKAWNELILSNIGFVVKIAKEYQHYNLCHDDLVQEGLFGLMEAVKRFDPGRDNRLVTFAVWWIRAKIKDYLIKNWSLVKYGTTTSQRKMFFRVGSIGEWETDEARSDKIQEIADNLNISPEDVCREERRIRDRILSLHDVVGRTDYSATCLGDTLVSNDFVSQDIELEARDEEWHKSRMLNYASSYLSPRETFVLEKRYLSEETWTLAEIGRSLGVSRERIRQIDKVIIYKMKKECETYIDQNHLPESFRGAA